MRQLSCLAEGLLLVADVKVEFEQLNNLMRALKKQMTLRVGIIGSKAKAQHKNTTLTNAQLGAIHEFGSISNNIPRRSFLWDSLVHELNLNKEEAREFRKFIWMQIFQKGSVEAFYRELGSKALQAIEEGFATEGFGEWAPLAKATWAAYERKKGVGGVTPSSHLAKLKKYLRIVGDRQILTDTGQLRRSISFKIIKVS